jgi:hypothetical protein
MRNIAKLFAAGSLCLGILLTTTPNVLGKPGSENGNNGNHNGQGNNGNNGNHNGNNNGGHQDTISSLNVVPVITSVNVVGGHLVASGIAFVTANGNTTLDSFTAPITLLSSSAAVTAGVAVTCPILNLQLGPIHLDLLGLVVDTSQICLTITANQNGGLLGQLLCGVANLLNTTPLDQILAGLSGSDLNNLLLGITALLNGALGNLAQALLTSISQQVPGPTCAILNLSLGPLNLNLLGLEVLLNNCDNGPITVTVTGERGALLGNLLCGLLGNGQILSGSPLLGLLDQLLGL